MTINIVNNLWMGCRCNGHIDAITEDLTCVWAMRGSGRSTKGSRITTNVFQYGRIRNRIVSITPISASKTNPNIQQSIISRFISRPPFSESQKNALVSLNWTNDCFDLNDLNNPPVEFWFWLEEGSCESFVHFRGIQIREKSITFSTKWCSPLTSTVKCRLAIRTRIYLVLCRPFPIEKKIYHPLSHFPETWFVVYPKQTIGQRRISMENSPSSHN